MAFPLTYHRITNSCFRTCSTRRCRSQVGLYVYTHRTISVRAEPTFERLRYILGGDRPSQTARLTVSPGPIQGRRLETQPSKSGIPPSPPHDLTALLPRLPPILYMNNRIPVLSCSKAPWGLSVLLRVAGIFTSSSISPGGLLRQCPDHYAFRAGQNLPDKEFRYLRTVIVTAAVYRGFNSMLRCLTSPLNLPAPGRRQPIYFIFRFRIDLCFW